MATRSYAEGGASDDLVPFEDALALLSELPQDLLVMVAACLPTPEDLSSFRAVCQQWRAAADRACTRLSPCATAPFAPRQALPVPILLGLTALADLDLSGCAATLSDGALQGILGCLAPTLEALRLDGCLLTNDKGLLRLPSCTRLRSLSLSRCGRISNTTVGDTLTRCSSLETLVLRECRRVSDKGIVALAGHGALRSLDLSFCYNITTKGIAALAAAPALETLFLTGIDRFWDGCLGDLAALRSLTELRLQACWQVTDEGLSLVAGLKGLRTLSLAEGCESVSDSGLRHLLRLEGLRSLNLSYSCWDVSAEGLASLADMHNITDLNLCGCYAVDDSVLMSVSSLPRLTSLNISECEPITDTGVLCLTRLTALQSLDMCWAFQVTGYAVEAIAHTLTSLTSLRLSRCQRLTDLAIASLGELQRLRLLHINKLHLVTDHGVEAVAQQLTCLTELDVGRCHKLSDASLDSIASAMPGLTSLNLIGCQGISSEGLRQLTRLEHLQALDVSGIPQIAAQGLPALPDLEQLVRLRMAGDAHLKQIQVVLNGPVPRLPRLRYLDFTGAEMLPPGSQVLSPSVISPRMLRTPLQSTIAATRGGWIRRSRPKQGARALPGLKALLPCLPRLRELRVSNMRDVSPAAISELSAANLKLSVVRVES